MGGSRLQAVSMKTEMTRMAQMANRVFESMTSEK
jgi:hypothetical protein